MSRLIPFFKRGAVRDQASSWLARMDRGLSPEEQEGLRQWLNRSPVHRQTLTEMSALWGEMDVLSELSRLFPLERYGRQHRTRRPSMGLAVAASVATLAVAAWLIVETMLPTRGGTLAETTQRVYQTGIGEQNEIDLPDGSRITLNTDSAVEVTYSARERGIRLLRGEGYFDVAHQPRRPFVVRSGPREVEAVGTAFNVRLEPKGLDVTVTEGRVKIRLAEESGPKGPASAQPEPQAELLLEAGKAARIRDNAHAVRTLDAVEVDTKLAWQRGMLIFLGEDLENVLAEFRRYAPVEFVTSEEIRDVKVAGYFRAGDIDGLLVALRDNFDIQAERVDGGKIVLSAR